MNFLRNNLKVIIGFLIGVILASGITVYATSYLAKDISYTKEGTNIKSVEDALNDLYKKNQITPINMNLNGIVMGTQVSRASYDALDIDNLNKYKKLTIQCDESVGTWIDANVYIDNQLVLTISDKVEHELTLNNNNKLKITCVSKNNLGLGGISFYLRAE